MGTSGDWSKIDIRALVPGKIVQVSHQNRVSRIRELVFKNSIVPDTHVVFPEEELQWSALLSG